MTIEDRLLGIADKSLVEEALVTCFSAVDDLITAIQTEAISFDTFAKEQRKALRREIVERH